MGGPIEREHREVGIMVRRQGWAEKGWRNKTVETEWRTREQTGEVRSERDM